MKVSRGVRVKVSRGVRVRVSRGVRVRVSTLIINGFRNSCDDFPELSVLS